MTDSPSDKGVPAKARPTVFHHEGRRLFLIDGEPRVVDVDIAAGLGYSRDRDFRALISRQRKGLAFFGPLLKLDPSARSIEVAHGDDRLRSDGAVDQGHLRSGSAVAGDLVEIVETRPVSRTKTWAVTSVLQKAIVV